MKLSMNQDGTHDNDILNTTGGAICKGFITILASSPFFLKKINRRSY